MQQFVIKSQHQPDQCPSANSKTRQIMIKAAEELPKLAQKLGVNFISGPLILGPEHEVICVVEADNFDTVQELIFQSGFIQWNTVRITPVMTLYEAIESLKKMPEPLY